MKRQVGPYQIVRKHDQFLVRKGRTILSKHDSFFHAEDAALRIWLGKGDFDYESQPDHIDDGASSAN